MHRASPSLASILSAATITVAAFGLSGCGADVTPAPASSPRAASAPGVNAAPLPSPDDLTGILYRLADTSIPAEQKVGLVQYATAADQPVLANFGEALRDGGFRDLSVRAEELGWAPQPGDVTAKVTLSASDDQAKNFTYPMEFSPSPGGWQLTRRTADQLFQLGAPPTSTAPR